MILNRGILSRDYQIVGSVARKPVGFLGTAGAALVSGVDHPVLVTSLGPTREKDTGSMELFTTFISPGILLCFSN